MVGLKFLIELVFGLVDLEFSSGQEIHRLDISCVDFLFNSVTSLMQLLEFTGGSQLLDLVTGSVEVLSFEKGQVEVNLAGSLYVISLDRLSEEVVDSALHNFFVTVLEGHSCVALGIADAPLDFLYEALVCVVAYQGRMAPFQLCRTADGQASTKWAAGNLRKGTACED